MSAVVPGLAVGPLLYDWERAATCAFYEAVAAAPVRTVYLGETVCAKRRALSPADWIALGRELAAAGKEPVLSTLTLVEARSELSTVRRLCENGEFAVEANDMSAVALLAERGVPFVGGPALNLYGRDSLAVLVGHGLFRWIPPVEMSGAALGELLAGWDPAVHGPLPQTELFALGRIPLAWSARCFTARAHGRPKDDCGFVCRAHPGGLALDTQDGERFLTLNGIQTQSGRPVNLFPHLDTIRELGISALRVSPMPGDAADLLARCRAVLDGERPPQAVADVLADPPCDGSWQGRAGLASASA